MIQYDIIEAIHMDFKTCSKQDMQWKTYVLVGSWLLKGGRVEVSHPTTSIAAENTFQSYICNVPYRQECYLVHVSVCVCAFLAWRPLKWSITLRSSPRRR